MQTYAFSKPVVNPVVSRDPEQISHTSLTFYIGSLLAENIKKRTGFEPVHENLRNTRGQGFPLALRGRKYIYIYIKQTKRVRTSCMQFDSRRDRLSAFFTYIFFFNIFFGVVSLLTASNNRSNFYDFAGWGPSTIRTTSNRSS